MEIIIKIDDERYKDIQRIAEVQLDRGRFQTAEQVIANGVPLPKGHGRLIDADKLEFEKCTLETDSSISFYMIDKEDVDNAPTIIEAE